MRGDRLAHAQRVHFHLALCLVLSAKGFFKCPSASAETFSAALFYHYDAAHALLDTCLEIMLINVYHIFE